MNNRPYSEIRSFTESISTRENDTQPITFEGYAARFLKLSHDLGGYRERIVPGAFRASLAKRDFDLYCLYGHDWNRGLARSSNGTLVAFEDTYGLRIKATPLPTTLARDTEIEVRGGLITGMSFGFNIVRSDVVEENGELVQELREIELYECSLVLLPAYPDTNVSLRNLTNVRDAANKINPQLAAKLEEAITAKRDAEAAQVKAELEAVDQLESQSTVEAMSKLKMQGRLLELKQRIL